jgi:hypothetical protein
MNPTRPRLLNLVTCATLAALLAACGGGEPETAANADGRARPLAAAPAVIAPLFDDEGNVVAASDSAVPADAAARTRSGRYATPDQATQLEETLGAMVIPVTVEPGPDAAAAVELAPQMVWGQQAAHELPSDAPVLVRGADLRLAAATVHQLEAAGHTRVFLVTH